MNANTKNKYWITRCQKWHLIDLIPPDIQMIPKSASNISQVKKDQMIPDIWNSILMYIYCWIFEMNHLGVWWDASWIILMHILTLTNFVKLRGHTKSPWTNSKVAASLSFDLIKAPWISWCKVAPVYEATHIFGCAGGNNLRICIHEWP